MKKLFNKKRILSFIIIAVIGLVCIVPSTKANAATIQFERLYRFYNGTDHFYARYSNYNQGKAPGYNEETSLGLVYVGKYDSSLLPVYRYYNGKDHFYTIDWSELGNGKDGYNYEGIEFYASRERTSISDTPVYRYYNGTDHFYTTNYNELGSGSGKYKYEKIAFYIF